MNEGNAGVTPGESKGVAPSQTKETTPTPSAAAATAGETEKSEPVNRHEQIQQWVRSGLGSGRGADAAGQAPGDESRPGDGKGSGAEPDLSHQPQSEAQPQSEEGNASQGDAGSDPEPGDREAPDGSEQKPEGDRWPKGALDRIRKLKEQRNKARDEAQTKDRELEDLRSRFSRLEKQQPGETPSIADEVETLTDESAILERQQTAERVSDWASARLARLSYEPESVERDLAQIGLQPPEGGWDAKSMGEALEGLRDRGDLVAKQAAPRRLNWLRTENQVVETVGKAFPELGEPDSPLQREVQDVLELMPGLKQQPNWLLLATVGAIGLREFRKRTEAGAAAAAKPAGAKPVPPQKPPRVPVPAAVAGPARTNEQNGLRDSALKKGAGEKDRRAWIRAQIMGTQPA